MATLTQQFGELPRPVGRTGVAGGEGKGARSATGDSGSSEEKEGEGGGDGGGGWVAGQGEQLFDDDMQDTRL